MSVRSSFLCHADFQIIRENTTTMEFDEKFQLRWHHREIMACAETNGAFKPQSATNAVQTPLAMTEKTHGIFSLVFRPSFRTNHKKKKNT